jgi:hypothetical protein
MGEEWRRGRGPCEIFSKGMRIGGCSPERTGMSRTLHLMRDLRTMLPLRGRGLMNSAGRGTQGRRVACFTWHASTVTDRRQRGARPPHPPDVVSMDEKAAAPPFPIGPRRAAAWNQHARKKCRRRSTIRRRRGLRTTRAPRCARACGWRAALAAAAGAVPGHPASADRLWRPGGRRVGRATASPGTCPCCAPCTPTPVPRLTGGWWPLRERGTSTAPSGAPCCWWRGWCTGAGAATPSSQPPCGAPARPGCPPAPSIRIPHAEPAEQGRVRSAELRRLRRNGHPQRRPVPRHRDRGRDRLLTGGRHRPGAETSGSGSTEREALNGPPASFPGYPPRQCACPPDCCLSAPGNHWVQVVSPPFSGSYTQMFCIIPASSWASTWQWYTNGPTATG